jgi:hypothetical protein
MPARVLGGCHLTCLKLGLNLFIFAAEGEVPFIWVSRTRFANFHTLLAARSVLIALENEINLRSDSKALLTYLDFALFAREAAKTPSVIGHPLSS